MLTSAQSNRNVKSASTQGAAFDVIVVADEESTIELNGNPPTSFMLPRRAANHLHPSLYTTVLKSLKALEKTGTTPLSLSVQSSQTPL